MRILLIEDNHELANMLVDRFKAEGNAVDLETDEHQANELLKHSHFDIIILDINLPNMKGYAMLRGMRFLFVRLRGIQSNIQRIMRRLKLK